MGAAEDIRFIHVLIVRRQLNENKEAEETQTNSRGRERTCSIKHSGAGCGFIWMLSKLEVFTLPVK